MGTWKPEIPTTTLATVSRVTRLMVGTSGALVGTFWESEDAILRFAEINGTGALQGSIHEVWSSMTGGIGYVGPVGYGTQGWVLPYTSGRLDTSWKVALGAAHETVYWSDYPTWSGHATFLGDSIWVVGNECDRPSGYCQGGGKTWLSAYSTSTGDRVSGPTTVSTRPVWPVLGELQGQLVAAYRDENYGDRPLTVSLFGATQSEVRSDSPIEPLAIFGRAKGGGAILMGQVYQPQLNRFRLVAQRIDESLHLAGEPVLVFESTNAVFDLQVYLHESQAFVTFRGDGARYFLLETAGCAR